MDKFFSLYQDLNSTNLHLLSQIYRADIQFIDPAHEINGLKNLTHYFSSLYQNLDSIDFIFHDVVQQAGSCYVQWDMTFCHGRLSRGNPITVSGATFLRFDDDDKVFYHRDYFDLGTMLYEYIPLLGRIITSIKTRLGQ